MRLSVSPAPYDDYNCLFRKAEEISATVCEMLLSLLDLFFETKRKPSTKITR